MCLDNVEWMQLEKNKKKERFSFANIHLVNENI